MEDLHPILGRTLVFVAHPDDEAVGCGALLQKIADPIVIYATDGAPRSDYFWKQYGSREAYATTRAQEAECALSAVGESHFHFLNEQNVIADQELFLNLKCSYEALAKIIETELPEAILSLAYEGGHPDHDACAFLAHHAARQFELPVWEMPLYHRANAILSRNTFVEVTGTAILPTDLELTRKRAMFAAYQSQSHVLAEFSPDTEVVRPMRDYGFSRPPHQGQLNYEAWRWPMSGNDLCQAFTQFLQQPSHLSRKRTWGTAA